MRKEFVMRGKTESGKTETLNFSGHKAGYGYKLTEFNLFPSTNVGGLDHEMTGTITAGKTAISPIAPDFNDEALIASAAYTSPASIGSTGWNNSIVNDTFMITQDLQLMVQDTSGTGPSPVNWQCRFESVKLGTAEEAVTNYKQFMISDE